MYSDNEPIDREILEKQYEIIKCAKYQDFIRLQIIIQPYILNNDIEMLNGINVLHWACYCGFTELIKKLISLNLDIEKEDLVNNDTAIYYAIKNSHYEIVLLLIEHFGPSILFHKNRRKMSPFLTAISEFNEDKILEALHILELLYLNGASLEEQNEYGQTALFLCVKRNNISTLQWLLSKSVNINHRDFYGNTILHIAVKYCDIDILRLLCDYGSLNLVHHTSMQNDSINVFQLCLRNRYFLVYILLKKWIIQDKLCKGIKICKTIYAFYFWFFAMLNLIVYLNISRSFWIHRKYHSLSITWIVIWLFQQFLWFILYFKSPGFYKQNETLTKRHSRRNTPFSYTYDSSFKRKTEYQLNSIEMELFKINKIISSSHMNPQIMDYQIEAQQAKYDELIVNLECQKLALYEKVSKERINSLDVDYRNAILYNRNPRNVCVTCNIVKPPRVHHCAECFHCIVHQDHHCVWVDNCIGIKNQRAFYLFIFSMFVLLLYNYYYVFLYFSLFHKTVDYAFALLVILCNFINITLFAFITYLFARNTRTILTNITFYEHFKKPSHITDKYNTELRCWDFQNLSLIKMLKNVYSFWSLNYDEPYLRHGKKATDDIYYTLISDRI
ncbi:palmitoyltransferase, putative [Plasmodium knowlesi strain H]|uniref:Palmitoyltransferase n=3 Tax=Plasmodium knowlesi TaxID=5850 RepID=A0A5K1VMT4_PLAKH|nr:palmitoyltransferase DHHC1, putative [Plasmodium knowlesi strain H]OTN66088.1 Palmitoyltransferase [Plasmodium knowlesi]CAA9988035.1 palmitoyltransferase DHHC1, putative [Plasmodium knowlesi strain H]SBO21981.1 palmitoyltransferase, putative [Plasmodium knowlesi strain H]SBO29490.1 palmitoyltransferase, putative [Plasmodium knowlesi strain H]VVS77509.1 palmitoyltransferase DHHC1, putative [Plasmodium knowlesi strain H]|eukprot:XP_002259014.1 Binding protein, putative [Plasmodium knowlesi strain H]